MTSTIYNHPHLNQLFCHARNMIIEGIECMLLHVCEVQPINQLIGQVRKITEGSEGRQLQDQIMGQMQVINKLLSYWLKQVQKHYVPTSMYDRLEAQTQKTQLSLRQQIKVQEQMRLYMEELENEVDKYEQWFKKKHNNILYSLREELQLLRTNHCVVEQQNSLLYAQNQQLQQQIQTLQQEVVHIKRRTTTQPTFMSEQTHDEVEVRQKHHSG